MRIVPYIALLNTRMIGPVPSSIAVASSCPVIMNPPSPQKPTTRRSGWPSWSAILQKAVRPAAEIAGVAGYDRIVGEAIAQPSHDNAEIERTAGRGGDQPSLVFRSCPFAPARPASRCHRRQCRGSGGEFGHAGLDRQGRAKYAPQLLRSGMHV